MRTPALFLLSAFGLLAACSQVGTSPKPLALETQVYNLQNIVDPPGFTHSGQLKPEDRDQKVGEVVKWLSNISPNSWRDIHSPGMPPGTTLHNPQATSDASIIAQENKLALTVTASKQTQKEVSSMLDLLTSDPGIHVTLQTQCFLMDEKALTDNAIPSTPDTSVLLTPDQTTALLASLGRDKRVVAYAAPTTMVHSGTPEDFYPGEDGVTATTDLTAQERQTGWNTKSHNRGFPVIVSAALSGDGNYFIVEATYHAPAVTLTASLATRNGHTLLLPAIHRNFPDVQNPSLPDRPILLILLTATSTRPQQAKIDTKVAATP